jgi:hypothetical protein
MFWVPAILVPGIGFGIRVQVAGLTIIVMLVFGYLWIIAVRLIINSFIKIGVIR